MKKLELSKFAKLGRNNKKLKSWHIYIYIYIYIYNGLNDLGKHLGTSLLRWMELLLPHNDRNSGIDKNVSVNASNFLHQVDGAVLFLEQELKTLLRKDK